MARYYYDPAAAGAGTGADWTNAFTTYAAAIAAASSANDVIWASSIGQEELAADTTFTHAANITVISINKADDTFAAMGTGGWIGNSTTNRTVSMAGAFEIRFVGITIRTAGSTADNIFICVTDGADYTYEDCYIWHGNTGTNTAILIGTNDTQCHILLRNCTLRFAQASQGVTIRGLLDVEGGSLSAAGTAPTAGLFNFNNVDPGGTTAFIIGFDMSHLGANPMVGDADDAAGVAFFSQCKLGASFVILATQTVGNKSGARVFVNDCASGDVNVFMGYADAMGTVVVDTGIFLTAGPAAASWKIVTTAAACTQSPFITPWLDKYVEAGSVTPEIEILRDGSATAYQDDEVWGGWAYKATSGVPMVTLVNDRVAILGTPANQAAGAGLGAWTGENATAWSGKLSPGALTVAEAGYLRSRIVVAEPSITVYADPDIGAGISDVSRVTPSGWIVADEAAGGGGNANILRGSVVA